MKKILLVLSFLSPFLAKAQEEQFIPWSERRLTWADYLARPVQSSDAAAITSTALGFEYRVRNNQLSYKITCKFSKTRSWGRHKTEYILSHEQGHFDITEIFARKLSKELKEYKFNPSKYQADLNKIYEKVMKEKEEFQNEYDEETDFSRKKAKQEDWLGLIAEKLMELEDFRDYSSFAPHQNPKPEPVSITRKSSTSANKGKKPVTENPKETKGKPARDR